MNREGHTYSRQSRSRRVTSIGEPCDFDRLSMLLIGRKILPSRVHKSDIQKTAICYVDSNLVVPKAFR